MADLKRDKTFELTKELLSKIQFHHLIRASEEYSRGDEFAQPKHFNSSVSSGWMTIDGVRAPIKTVAYRACELTTNTRIKAGKPTTNDISKVMVRLGNGRVFDLRNSANADKNPDNTTSKIGAEERRYKKYVEVLARPGQAKFRMSVLEAYKYSCAITQCAVVPALEAAHILPVRDHGDDTVNNGILFRADLHRLFDAGLMAIDPDSLKVRFAKLVARSYPDLDGGNVQVPEQMDFRPSTKALRRRWKSFHEKYGVAQHG